MYIGSYIAVHAMLLQSVEHTGGIMIVVSAVTPEEIHAVQQRWWAQVVGVHSVAYCLGC